VGTKIIWGKTIALEFSYCDFIIGYSAKTLTVKILKSRIWNIGSDGLEKSLCKKIVE
jgi:hypothetical protein